MSCMNSGSRILFSMARFGIFPIEVGSSHKHNLTPHLAITIFAAIQFLIPTLFMLCIYLGGDNAANTLQIGVPLDAFNDAGTLGAMGFCGAYVLISLAAPFYLMKIGEAKPYHWVLSIVALLLLIVPIVGLVWPVPLNWPMNVTPYVFAVYIVVGAILVFVRTPSSSEIASIRKVLDDNVAADAVHDSSPAAIGGGEPAMA
jgi:amino acid transporter